MNHVKVSVVVPVYNMEPYLRKCLDSLVNQTLNDIEIICVNDCSQDDCLAILNEYAEKDSRIKIIDFEKNQGVSKARNAGMKMAVGEYTGFCDPDDYVDLDFYNKLYNKVKETGADIAHSNVKQKQLNDLKEYILFPHKFKGTFANALMWFVQCIYRTDLLRRNKIEFPLNIIWSGEDHCFLVKALIFANRLEYVHNIFYHYIINSNSSVIKSLSIESVHQLPQFYIIELLNSSNVSKEFYLKIFYIFFNRFIILYNRFTTESRPLIISGFEQYYGLCKYPEDIKIWIPVSICIGINSFEELFFLLKKESEESAYPQISIKQQILEERKLYVWGTGRNGIDALVQCDNNGWKIEAFLDSDPQLEDFQGYNVLLPHPLLNSKDRDFFIVISSKAYAGEIAQSCEEAGLKEGEDFWKPELT